jgi:hypothetical protein
MQECVEAPNESAARTARFHLLGIIEGHQPQGFTVGALCGSKLCIAPEHVLLREYKRPMGQKWGPLAEQIAALPMDGILVLRDYPHGRAARAALNLGVGSTKTGRYLRFLIRQIPSGGVRIIRTGDHSCFIEGREGTQTDREYKSAYAAVIPNGLAPGALFLGMLWGTGCKRPNRSRCEVKACPRDVYREGMCRFHRMFFATDSRGYRGSIDLRDIYPSEDGREPKLHTGMLYTDAFDWKRVSFFLKDSYRRKEERISDEWWDANVGAAT